MSKPEQEHPASRSERGRNGYTDAQRLDWLENDVKDDPLLLHNLPFGTKQHGFRGLGLSNTGRTLREAIDECMSAHGIKPSSSERPEQQGGNK